MVEPGLAKRPSRGKDHPVATPSKYVGHVCGRLVDATSREKPKGIPMIKYSKDEEPTWEHRSCNVPQPAAPLAAVL